MNYNYLFQWTNSCFILKVGLIRNVPMGFSPQLLDSITPAFPRRNLVGMKRLAGKKSEPYQHRVESYLKEFKTWVKLRNNKNALNPKSHCTLLPNKFLLIEVKFDTNESPIYLSFGCLRSFRPMALQCFASLTALYL